MRSPTLTLGALAVLVTRYLGAHLQVHNGGSRILRHRAGGGVPMA